MAAGIKTGGRKPGTPNKVTRTIREMLQEILEGELNNLPSLLEGVNPRDRLQFIAKLLPYVIPQVETDIQDEGQTKPNFFDLVNQQILEKMDQKKNQ